MSSTQNIDFQIRYEATVTTTELRPFSSVNRSDYTRWVAEGGLYATIVTALEFGEFTWYFGYDIETGGPEYIYHATAGPKDDVDEPIMMLAFSDIRQSTV